MSLAQALIGTWELISRVDRTSAGDVRVDPSLGPAPLGMLVYDRTGHFAAQFMKRDRNAADDDIGPAGSNNSRARGGYDAYFGTYTVDDEAGTVTQRLIGALSPENVGHVFTRAMTVAGDELRILLETTGAGGQPIVRTLCWRRVA